ncbi:hypothetical protein EYW49_09610 [Siculibacillus lacustris]|uniref:Secreted protein n=1 Tax=Siculibacillus lacustris TaxID=1549641 RepID=A0A4Q9VRW5_9HYPH|nr:hypothetical protein EYW49_09610 [Siculibacillus lacustris]
MTQNTLPRRIRLSTAILAVVAVSASGFAVPARACEPDAPGWRDAEGHCVTWRLLETRCGTPASTHCTPDAPDPASTRLLPTPKGDPSAAACSGCGCKGGPGYRGPNGRCVAWRDLARTCGPTLPGACVAEIVDPRAGAITAQEALIAGKPRGR